MIGYVLFILIVQSVKSLPFIDDNKLLSLILEEPYVYNGYTVVRLETTIWDLNEYPNASNPWIVHGYDCEPLLRQLIEKNRQPVELTIESDLLNGYIIDKDKKFSQYFLRNGGGWRKLYKENPNVRGLTSVSLPVYDKQTNLVLVYKDVIQHYLAGEGNLIVYSLDTNNGTLQELMREMLWIA